MIAVVIARASFADLLCSRQAIVFVFIQLGVSLPTAGIRLWIHPHHHQSIHTWSAFLFSQAPPFATTGRAPVLNHVSISFLHWVSATRCFTNFPSLFFYQALPQGSREGAFAFNCKPPTSSPRYFNQYPNRIIIHWWSGFNGDEAFEGCPAGHDRRNQ